MAKRTHGFTLVELLFVIAIISLLASVILAGMNDIRSRAVDTLRITDMKSIQNALALYLDDNAQYPEETSDCSGWDYSSQGASFINPIEDPRYISEVPLDPTGDIGCGALHAYRYRLFTSGELVGGGCNAPYDMYHLQVLMMDTASARDTSPDNCPCPAQLHTANGWSVCAQE